MKNKHKPLVSALLSAGSFTNAASSEAQFANVDLAMST